MFRIAKGLIKKVLLGDYIAAYFADCHLRCPQGTTAPSRTLLALYAFTLQMYADFSGYSDIAIGVARLLGFRIPENFDRPYPSAQPGRVLASLAHDPVDLAARLSLLPAGR